MATKTTIAPFAAAALAVASAFVAAPAMAAPTLSTIDGAKSAGEYDDTFFSVTRDSFINGVDASGGFQRTTRFLNFDANYVYVAFEADTAFETTRVNDNGTPSDTSDDFNETANAFASRPGNFVNAYLYSSSPSQFRSDGTTASYGDGDDVVIETTNSLGFGNPNGITESTRQSFVPVAGTDRYVDDPAVQPDGIVVGFDGTSNFYEAAISRDLVDFDDYTGLRVGGQAFAYGFTFNTVELPVPEPTAVAAAAAAAAAAGLLALRSRRRRA